MGIDPRVYLYIVVLGGMCMKPLHEVAHLVRAGEPLVSPNIEAFLLCPKGACEELASLYVSRWFQAAVNRGEVEYFASYASGEYVMDPDDVEALPRSLQSVIDHSVMETSASYFDNDPVFVWEGAESPLRMAYVSAMSGFKMFGVISLVMLCWVPYPRDIQSVREQMSSFKLKVMQEIAPNLFYVTGPTQYWISVFEEFRNLYSYTDRCIRNPNRTVWPKGKLLLSAPTPQELRKEVLSLSSASANLERDVNDRCQNSASTIKSVCRIRLE